MATNTTVNLTPEQQRALASLNSYLQTRTGDTLTASQQTAPKQLTDAEITEYLKAVTQSPSSSGKDITANILKDWGQGNRYTAERILGDASTYNVSDERLAGILGIAPEGIASTRDKIVNYRKLAGTLAPSVGEYLDPVTGKDYSSQMGLLLAAKLDDLGLNGYNKATGKEIDPILFDDKAGTKYVLTEQGIQKQFDPTARFAVQLRSYVDPSSTGGAWGTKGGKKSPPGFGPEGMMRQIASRVQGATGVSDINDLGIRSGGADEENPYEIYNKKTGQKIRDGSYIDLGGWGEGPGITYASMTFDANGKPKISTYGEDTNTLSQFQPIMTLASIIPSPIQPFAVAANAANAAYNYGNWAPAIMAAAGASGILDSIAGSAGASNSGIAGLAQDLGASANLANSIGRVGAQSLLGGTLSAAQGKGFLPGAKSGLVSSVIGEGVNALGEITGLDKGLGSLAAPARSLVSSALTSTALGTPFNFSEAAKNAAMKFGLNTFTDKANLTPQQGTALNSLLEYLGKKA